MLNTSRQVDNDDEDVAKAIALSLQQVCSRHSVGASVAAYTVDREGDANVIAKLDRCKMELERLQRLKGSKRGRSISPPAKRSSKLQCLEESTTVLTSGAKLNRITQVECLIRKDERVVRTGEEVIDVPQAPTPEIPLGSRFGRFEIGDVIYPKGAVKITWAFGHDRTKQDIKIEEVLEPATLTTAVLSAFQWDVDWIRSKLRTPENGGSTKCVFVMQGKDPKLRAQMLRDTKDLHWLRLCFPPMTGQISHMHSKLMLLFHPKKLRVVVPSANLRNFDWGETGEMENSLFLVDLPRLESGVDQTIENLTCFGRELLYFMRMQQFPENVSNAVLKFSFKATVDMAFVHTIGGSSRGEAAQRTATPGLMRAIRNLNLRTDYLHLDVAASSIGALNDAQLCALHDSARGEDATARPVKMQDSIRKGFFQPIHSKSRSCPVQHVRDVMRIHFPSSHTVRSSKAGKIGTICIARRWFEKDSFPRSVFRDYRSKRDRLLSHNKLVFARGYRTTDEGSRQLVNWLYLGSANMSESAWGKVTRDGDADTIKVSCRNWECGVILPVYVSPPRQSHLVKTGATVNELKGADFDARDDAECRSRRRVDTSQDSETESESGSEETREQRATRRSINMRDGAHDKIRDTVAPSTVLTEELMSGISDISVFDSILSPPFEVPGELYDQREPWYFEEAGY